MRCAARPETKRAADVVLSTHVVLTRSTHHVPGRAHSRTRALGRRCRRSRSHRTRPRPTAAARRPPSLCSLRWKARRFSRLVRLRAVPDAARHGTARHGAMCSRYRGGAVCDGAHDRMALPTDPFGLCTQLRLQSVSAGSSGYSQGTAGSSGYSRVLPAHPGTHRVRPAHPGY
jgi:hypothetical protein